MILTNPLSLHCKWLCSVWLFPMFWNYLYDESLIIYGDICGVLLDMPFEEISKLKENNSGESVGVDF